MLYVWNDDACRPLSFDGLCMKEFLITFMDWDIIDG
jgi:hypothetical protein